MEHTPEPYTVLYITSDADNEEQALERKAEVRLRKAAPDLLEALEAVEWSGGPFGIPSFCPWCWKKPESEWPKHAPDCQRQVTLAKAKGD